MARKDGKRWTADVRSPINGRVKRTFDTLKQAEAWETLARDAVRRGLPVPEPDRGGQQAVTGPGLTALGNLFDHVCVTEWDFRKSGKTLKINGRSVVDHFGRDRDIRTITSSEVALFRVAMSEKGNTTATVNRKCAALSKMLHTAQDEGIQFFMPKMHMRREEQTRFRYLDPDEERLLLAYWRGVNDEVMADLCIFLLDTGTRCFSEAVPLKWADISADDRTATFWVTKTGKPRTLPLTDRCREVLERRRREVGERYGPFWGVGERTMRSRWDDMRRVLNFPDVTPHTLRHTCCTRLILGGADVKRVMTWMGHSSIQTTMRYMQVRTTDMEELLGILGG